MLRLTIISAQVPSTLGKVCSLRDDGSVNKEPSGNLSWGLAEVRETGSIAEFMALRAGLGTHQALAYGLPDHAKALIVSKINRAAAEADAGGLPVITRSGADFRYADLTPGILALDYDPVAGLPALTPDSLREALYATCPALREAPHALIPSAGSCIYPTGANEPLVGVKGLRVYVAVKDAGDIHRAGITLHQRLMLNGMAVIVVSQSGRLLNKSPVDTALFEPSHLDFVRATCGAGLEQRLPAAELFNDSAEPLDTSKIKELSKAEEKRLEELLTRLKAPKREEAARARTAHEQRRVERLVAAAPEAEQENVRRNAYRELKTLRDHQRLAPDTLLQFAHEDEAVTVRDVLARLADYDGKYLLDPEEPEYNGNRAVAWLSRDEKSGEAKVFSHAHGGDWRYVLVDDRQWEQQCRVEDGHAVLVDNTNPMKPTLLQPSEGARQLLPVLHGMGVGYDATQMEWMRYDPALGIWCVDPAVTQWNRVEDTIYAHAAGIGYTSHYVQELLTFLKGKMIAQVNQEETTRGLLPMRNGVLRLDDKVLLPHSPEYGFTWCLPYDFDPAATCEPVKQWLKEAGGDDSVVGVLQALLNAIVIGRSDLQRYAELIGPGGSGKGTYLRLAGDLVGERNHYATTFKALEGNRFETAAVYNKRLVTVGDAEKWNGGVDTLKAMTGEDVLRYEAKHKQQNSDRKYTYTGMVLVAANTEIKSSDYTSGLQRRRIAIRFDKIVGAGNRRDLGKEFAPLLPGVLNWALELDTAEVTKRLRLTDEYSSTIAESNSEYLVATNPVAAWADEWLVADAEAKSPINRADRKDNSLYPSYVGFCEATNKGSALSMQNFSSGLFDLLVAQLKMGWVERDRNKHGSTFNGVRLRRPTDDYFTATLVTNQSRGEVRIDPVDLERTKPEVMKQRIFEGAQELVIKVNGSQGAERDGQVREWVVSTTREENRLRAKAGIDEEGLSEVDVFTHEALKHVGLPMPRLH